MSGYTPLGKRLISATETFFGIKNIHSQTATSEYVTGRRAVAIVLKEFGWSHVRIGKLLKRDHTTIVQALKGSDQRIAENEELRILVGVLRGEAEQWKRDLAANQPSPLEQTP